MVESILLDFDGQVAQAVVVKLQLRYSQPATLKKCQELTLETRCAHNLSVIISIIHLKV